jgi:hypothetical protein
MKPNNLLWCSPTSYLLLPISPVIGDYLVDAAHGESPIGSRPHSRLQTALSEAPLPRPVCQIQPHTHKLGTGGQPWTCPGVSRQVSSKAPGKATLIGSNCGSGLEERHQVDVSFCFLSIGCPPGTNGAGTGFTTPSSQSQSVTRISSNFDGG